MTDCVDAYTLLGGLLGFRVEPRLDPVLSALGLLELARRGDASARRFVGMARHWPPDVRLLFETVTAELVKDQLAEVAVCMDGQSALLETADG